MKTIGYVLAGILFIGVAYFYDGTRVPIVQDTQTIELKDGDTYELTAAYVSKRIAGKEQRMLAYNGSIPGPTFTIPQGSEVTIRLKNDTDVPTALHAHGVRMKNEFDGAPPFTQKEIAPGETFSYTLSFPDAGVYWYHPHVHESYAQPLGLYGAFLVTPKDAQYFPPVNQEMPLVLSDIPVANGKIQLYKDDSSHALMGRYGNVFLTNGTEQFSLTAHTGEVARFYVVNAATARPFNLAIEGAKIKVVGGDNGAYERAFFADQITLGPSERAIIDVFFEKPGAYVLQNRTPVGINVLGHISVDASRATKIYKNQFLTLQENRASKESMMPFLTYANKNPDKEIRLALSGMMSVNETGHGAHMMSDGTMMGGTIMPSQSVDGIEWESEGAASMMRGSVSWQIIDEYTGASNMAIDWVFERNKPVKIRIINPANSMHPMQHPIHFHGQRFLLVSRNGVRQTNLVWKDTVLVRAGETVEIILDPSNPGSWMAHCHIAEHLSAGMMFTYQIK